MNELATPATSPAYLHVRLKEPTRTIVLALAEKESRPVSQMTEVLLKEAIAARLAKRKLAAQKAKKGGK